MDHHCTWVPILGDKLWKVEPVRDSGAQGHLGGAWVSGVLVAAGLGPVCWQLGPGAPAPQHEALGREESGRCLQANEIWGVLRTRA